MRAIAYGGVSKNSTLTPIPFLANSTITATETGGGNAEAVTVLNNSTGTVLNGNTISATASGGTTAVGLNVISANLTVTGNALSATGAGTNEAVALTTTTIQSGSTGNIKVGSCSNGGANTGQMTFTDGSHCP